MSHNFFDDFDEDFDGVSANEIPSNYVRKGKQKDSVKIKLSDKQRKQAKKQFNAKKYR